MKTSNFRKLSIALVLIISTLSANQAHAGWKDVPDGYTYQDSNGCMHHVHTQEYRLLGIKFASRTVDDTVAC